MTRFNALFLVPILVSGLASFAHADAEQSRQAQEAEAKFLEQVSKNRVPPGEQMKLRNQITAPVHSKAAEDTARANIEFYRQLAENKEKLDAKKKMRPRDTAKTVDGPTTPGPKLGNVRAKG